ncbi:MAG TPA: amidohydrolase family protein, partial [Burkholderiales bacterium]|nr:amidohydrolase family protein [Burkholderiales bacterium]
MRNGYKVYDSDTHIQPGADTLEKYLSARVRELVPDLEKLKVPWNRISPGIRPDQPYSRIVRIFRLRGARVGGWGADVPRMLGEAEPRDAPPGVSGRFMGSKFPRPGSDDWDAEGRIHDMDEEGVDVQLLVNSGGPSGHENPAVNVEFMRAQHRYLDDFCSKYPHRLKSMIAVNARYVEESAEEIRRWSRSPWAAGVYLNLPIDYPLDHPDLHPLWQAMDEAGLCYIHHSFAEGYPGYRDLWRNPFLGRSASHPWGAMRAMGAFFGAGLLDRYPRLRFAVLESGFGWIPFWAARMEDQAQYMGFVAEGLKHTMLEYTSGGRFFASIVLHEGGKMVKMVSDYLGDHILMFSTDYPHPETRFPESVDLCLGWPEINPGLMQKILWDNA